MSEDRRLAVLRAIVEDYVSTREPVASKALVERHHLGVSSATIRNDMAVLEEEGYIVQPHTSAGRIPTDKGYRLFVDRLHTLKPLSSAEKRAITSLLDGAVDLDDILDRTVRLLAQLTRQVAVVAYPSLTRSTVRHIELVCLPMSRLMIVVISDSGRVEQRVVETGGDIQDELLRTLRDRINATVAGRRLSEVVTMLAALPADLAQTLAPGERDLVAPILEALVDALALAREERIVLAGTANLARSGPDFGHHITPVLEALEEQVVLLRLLDDMSTQTGDVGVLIGRENSHEGLAETALVAGAYSSGGQALASLGVLGPTRMDYATSITAVRAVARYVSRILGPER